jgi:hypothetical protein
MGQKAPWALIWLCRNRTRECGIFSNPLKIDTNKYLSKVVYWMQFKIELGKKVPCADAAVYKSLVFFNNSPCLELGPRPT